jgi:glycosyltransferase involved in cell wall biosynthesis
MRAAIYNPYIDTLGGGERYTFSFVKLLIDKGYEVDIEWNDKSFVKKIKDRFGIDIKNANFVNSVNRGDGYDLCFWVSDGSIPTMRARDNILHFQIPFTKTKGKSLINKMKLYRINHVVCNSGFTKSFIDNEYGVDSVVIYPPVDVEKFKPKRKENIILYVGRFSNLKQSKGQNVLIDAFKKFYDRGFIDWKLVLAGGVEVGSGDYLLQLEKMTENYPVKIIKSPPLSDLVNYYGKAKFFWSASGYGVDEYKYPEKVEHFGIAPVEAMAAKCIPILYAKGGHKEIIEDGQNGYLWENVQDLIFQTEKLADDASLLKKLSDNSRISSKNYEVDKFEKEFSKII